METERLILRRVKKNDAPGIFRCFSHSETMRFMGTPLDEPESVEGIVDDYISGFSEGYSLVWALEDRLNGEFLGTAGFEEFSFLDMSAEAGFSILNRHQGRGFMAEAMAPIITFGFDSMKLNRIEARIHPENRGGVRLAEKLGFRLEGHLRKSVFFNGGFHDQLVFSIIGEDRGK